MDNNKAVDLIHKALGEKRTRKAIYLHFFGNKHTESNCLNWSESEDEILKKKLIPLVKNKNKLRWTSLYDELKAKLPGRSLVAMRTRWTNYLDIRWKTGDVDDEEKAAILKEFELHAWHFSKYKKRKRSVPFLRTFIANHIQKLHTQATSQTICVHFYEKLTEMLTTSKPFVKIDEWIQNCSNGDTKLAIVYKYIFFMKRRYMFEMYGILKQDSNMTIDQNAIYPVMRRRKPSGFPLTQNDILYLDQLIAKYSKIDKTLIKVERTPKCLHLLNDQLHVKKTPIERPDIQKYELDPEIFCQLQKDIECVIDDEESFSLPATADAECTLFAFGLPHNRVELAFSKHHPIDRILCGLRDIRNGKGCKSWYKELIIKRQDFDIMDLKTIITLGCVKF